MAQALDSDYVLRVVEGMAAIPSVSGNEDAVSTYVEQELRDLGLAVEVQEVLPGRRNVVATLEFDAPGPTLLFNGHLDTLPVPKEGWTGDPFCPRRADGRLICAEVNNMKAAVGGMMGAIAALRGERASLRGRVILSAVIGECDALGLGTTHMLGQGVTADCAINGEPTDLKVMTAHSGVTQLSIHVEGRGVHVCQREVGVDAIGKMVRLLAAIDESALDFEPHPDFPGLPTLNIGIIRGGVLASMLAEDCEAEIDVRKVPGMTPEGIKADLEAVIERARADDPALSARVELSPWPKFCHPPAFHMARDAAIVRTVAEAHAALAGSEPEVGTFHPQVFFGSDASHLVHAGIPTAIYGPGKVEDINTADEGIAVEDVIQAARVYLGSARQVCGGE